MANVPPEERDLVRKTSKSKLSKQAEVVEDEDFPGGAKVKIPVPETRVESFDELDEEYGDEDGSPVLRSKLVRSHALCGDDDTKLKARGLEKQGSSKSGSAGSSLSRDSSNDSKYTDSTGIDLEAFIRTTLHKNAKDRQMILQLEEELSRFVQDANKPVHKFPPMSSYNRMLVHRIAAFFGVDHNVDQSGTSVVVNKTPNSRVPDTPFSEYIQGDAAYIEEPKRLLKRDVQSYEEVARGDGISDIRKAKSFEEREEDYERARARIFLNQDSSSSAEIIESPISGYSSDSFHAHTSSSCATGDVGARPWSSTDSGSLDVPSVAGRGGNLMAMQQKAGSFGGVPSAYHKDILRTPPRRSNTDASKGAEMSPGSMARHRHAQLPGQPCPIPEHPGLITPQQGVTMGTQGQQVIFAVSSWDQVPAGAMIFNPQTGQPYLNPDSSPYRHVGQFSTATASPGGSYMQAPFIHTDPNVLCGGMQGMSLTSTPTHSPSAGFQPSQILTYVMPHSGPGSECGGSSTSPPPQHPGQPLVVQMQSPYMQASPVQYQSSVQYVMPSPQVVYPESGTHTEQTVPSTSGYAGMQGYPQVVVMMPPQTGEHQVTPQHQSPQVPLSQATNINFETNPDSQE